MTARFLPTRNSSPCTPLGLARALGLSLAGSILWGATVACSQQPPVQPFPSQPFPPARVTLGIPYPSATFELELQPSHAKPPAASVPQVSMPKVSMLSIPPVASPGLQLRSVGTALRQSSDDEAFAEMAIPGVRALQPPNASPTSGPTSGPASPTASPTTSPTTSPASDDLLPPPQQRPQQQPVPAPAAPLGGSQPSSSPLEDIFAIPSTDSRQPNSPGNSFLPSTPPPLRPHPPLTPTPGLMPHAASSPEHASTPPNSTPPNTATSSQPTNTLTSSAGTKVPYNGPEFFVLPTDMPYVDPLARRIPVELQAFAPSVHPYVQEMLDPLSAELIYRGKFAVPTQRPLLEWGRPLYTGGIYPPGKDWFGSTNLVMPHFMVYGDYRTGVGLNRATEGAADVWASRLNLDMDLELTATERIHAFMGPLDRAGDFTRVDFTNDLEFVNRTDLRLDTLFFEGDAGAIVGGLNDADAPFDLPFTFGFIPLIYQNGIWANDNVIGGAFALPTRHSRLLNWANYDATFFWASDQVTSDAFTGENSAAEFFGTAWFIDAYEGHIETNYAYVNDKTGGDRSYHNLAVAFTRRYFMRISNSIRYITNLDQQLPDEEKTASGHLLLLENSLISAYPNTVVPYFNLFYGQGSPQSLGRAGGTGGILNNVGINFETDALTGYPTLDVTGHNAYGAALGVNLMGTNFSHQLVLEAAALGTSGSQEFRNAASDQYALGLRYQKPLNNAWIFRTDHMYGWLRDSEDIRGSRVELRWKF